MSRRVAFVASLGVLAACSEPPPQPKKTAVSQPPAKTEGSAAKTTAKPAERPSAADPKKGNVFVENAEGQIVFEAEHFHEKVDKDPHKWVLVKEPAGFSGDGAMEAKPNEDANYSDKEDALAKSPRMDYKVKFAHTGVYKVWVRGFGRSEEDNSVHAGLDGQWVDSADKIGEFPVGEWAWLNDTHDNEPATIEIKTAGLHTFNIWMREDGFIIDKILLTRKTDHTPTGMGPAESKE